MTLDAKFLNAAQLTSNDGPPTLLLTVYDPAARDTLTLTATPEAYEAATTLPEFADLRLDLSWRRLDLTRSGGALRGKGYRLRVVGVGPVAS